jgi:hypothetical protein
MKRNDGKGTREPVLLSLRWIEYGSGTLSMLRRGVVTRGQPPRRKDLGTAS